MATLLQSRPTPFLPQTASTHVCLSKAPSFLAWRAQAMTTQDTSAPALVSAPRVSISHWSPVQQVRLLANLAQISQDNKGWILMANAPAPLSRQALIKAGINPARVIEAKQASPQLLEQAMSSASIAAVVCWKGARVISSTLTNATQQRLGAKNIQH